MFRTYKECNSDNNITINLNYITKIEWIDSWKTFGAVAVISLTDGTDVITPDTELLETDILALTPFLNQCS